MLKQFGSFNTYVFRETHSCLYCDGLYTEQTTTTATVCTLCNIAVVCSKHLQNSHFKRQIKTAESDERTASKQLLALTCQCSASTKISRAIPTHHQHNTEHTECKSPPHFCKYSTIIFRALLFLRARDEFRSKQPSTSCYTTHKHIKSFL